MADDDVKKEEVKEPKTEEPKTAKAEGIPLAKYKELEDRYAALESTLKALATPATPQQRRDNPVQADLQDRVSLIAKRLNAEPDQVRQWDPFMATYFEELSRPYINAMAAMADKIEKMEVRGEISDYDKFSTEIDTERNTRLQRGEYLAPREAYHLVRSRRLPEILEMERAKAVEESRNAAAATEQANDSIGTDVKAGPTPTKQSTVTAESFKAMTLEEKEKALEGTSF